MRRLLQVRWRWFRSKRVQWRSLILLAGFGVALAWCLAGWLVKEDSSLPELADTTRGQSSSASSLVSSGAPSGRSSGQAHSAEKRLSELQALEKLEALRKLAGKQNYQGLLDAIGQMEQRMEQSRRTLAPKHQLVLERLRLTGWTGLGWQQLRSSRSSSSSSGCMKAMQSFNKAQTLVALWSPQWAARPDLRDIDSLLAQLHKGRGYCLSKLGHRHRASKALRTALTASWSDASLHRYYLSSLETQGEYQTALDHLDEVESQGSFDGSEWLPSYREKLQSLAAKTELRRGRQQVEFTGAFEIAYDAHLHHAEVGWITSVLEQSLEELISNWGFSAPSRTIRVVLYLHEDWRSLPIDSVEWIEGLFDGRIRVPMAQNLGENEEVRQRWVRLIRHELVHAVWEQMLPPGHSLPSWFEEGVAQRLSCRQTGDLRDFCGQLQFPLKRGQLLEMSVLDQSPLNLSKRQALRHYRQSLLLVALIEKRFGSAGLVELIERTSQLGRAYNPSMQPSWTREMSPKGQERFGGLSAWLLSTLDLTLPGLLDMADKAWRAGRL